MQQFYYRVNESRLAADGKLKQITDGLYRNHYEIHVCPEDIELPSSIPILVVREIPWQEKQRHDILRGTDVWVGFPSGEEVYEVVTDWDTVDGHLIVVFPVNLRKRRL